MTYRGIRIILEAVSKTPVGAASRRDLSLQSRQDGAPTVAASRQAGFLRSLLIAGLALFTSVETSAQQEKDQTLIEAQALGSALQVLAEEYDLQVLFESAVVANHTAQAIPQGTSRDAALGDLLSGTDLTYDFVNERTVAIRGGKDEAIFGDERGASDSNNPTPVLMAQNQTSQAQTTTSSRSKEQGRVENSDEPPKLKIPEIIVRGRSSSLDIRRSENDAQPYVTFDSEDIERATVSSVEEFLRTRLPMNTNQVASGFGRTGQNTSRINLRGLGIDQTLILVNGRRVTGLSTGFDVTQPDLNGIPLSAIERIEVLPSTASGIYGGGATGGVVNVILKSDYSGFEVVAGYDNTFDTDSAMKTVSANAGFDFNDGKTNIALSGSYSETNPMLNGDRDYLDRSRALQVRNNPDYFFSGSIPTLASTPNISSVATFDLAHFLATREIRFTREDLVLDDGTPLNSPFTNVPAGYAGVQADGGAALVGNAGQYNFNIADDVSLGANGSSLVNNPTVYSLSASIRNEFSDLLTAYFDVSHSSNKGNTYSSSGFPRFAFLDADAPNNPFDSRIVVSFPSPNVAFRNQFESENLNFAAGLIFKFSNDWGGSIDVARTENEAFTNGASSFVRPTLSADLATGVLDVVRDPNAFPVDFSPYLIPQPTLTSEIESELSVYSVRVAGPVFELGGGPVTVTGLLERREQIAKDSTATFIGSDESESMVFYPEQTQDVTSVYVEANLPLVSNQNSMPLATLLELQVAARNDSYETRALADYIDFLAGTPEDPFPDISRTKSDVESTDVTVGLRYSPVEDVIFRASYGTGFLPPSLSQVTQELRAPSSVFVADPQRDNVPMSIPIEEELLRGNPDLAPEESESLSIGLVYNPKAIAGLRLSVDYTNIKKTDEIATLPPQTIIDREAEFPGRVVRGPIEPDAPPGFTAGPIIGFNRSFVNIAALELTTWDFQVDYEVNLSEGSRLSLFTVATYFSEFRSKILPDDEFVDLVGFADGPNEWRATGGIDWQKRAFLARWSTQYSSSKSLFGSASSDSIKDRIVLNDQTTRLRSQTVHNLSSEYDFGASPKFVGTLLDQTRLTVGINNLFEEEPQIRAEGAIGFPGSSLNGVNPRGRSYFVQIRRAFD